MNSNIKEISQKILGSRSLTIQQSIDVAVTAITVFGDSLWFSFNAGKDNTVCLYIVAAAWLKIHGDFPENEFV